MPRKSKRNLFRRGDSQLFIKSGSSKKRKNIIEAIHSNQSIPQVIYLLTLMASLMLVLIILPKLTPKIYLYLKTITNQLFIYSERVSNITETINLQVPKLGFPQIKWPDLTMALQKVKADLFFSYFFTIIYSINPGPLLHYLASLLNELNSFSFNYVLWTIKTVFYILSYLDPRPGAIIFFTNLINAVFYITGLINKIIIFINPLPTMKIVIDAEIMFTTRLFDSLLMSILFLKEIIYIIIDFIFNILIYIINYIFTIFNKIIFSVTNLFIKIINGINLGISQFLKLLSYYLTPVSNNFNMTVVGLIESSKYLNEFIKAVLNQYNQYHPR